MQQPKIDLSEYQWTRKNNPNKYRAMCKSMRDNEDSSTLLKYATIILQNEVNDRLEEELLLLMKATEQLNFFTEMNSKPKNKEKRVHLQCCQLMTYEHYNQGDIIFKQGDKGDKAYILLDGKINVYIALDPNQIKAECENSRKQYNNLTTQAKRLHPIGIISNSRKGKMKHKLSLPFHLLGKLSILNPNQGRKSEQILRTIKIKEDIKLEEDKDREQMENMHEYGLKLTSGIPPACLSEIEYFFQDGIFKHKFIVEMGTGQMFGEVALLMNQPRSATIVAKTDVHLAVLNSIDYKTLLKETQLDKIDQRILFFKQYFFTSQPRFVVLRYCYNFKKHKYLRGQFIYNEGDKPNHIYIIKKGSVDVTYNQLMHVQVSPAQLSLLAKSQEQLLLSTHTVGIKANRIEHQRVVYSLSDGQIFGDIEIMLKLPCREANIKVTSTSATIFSLQNHQLQRILSDQTALRNQFMNNANMKQDYNNKLIQNIAKLYQDQMNKVKINQQIYLINQQEVECKQQQSTSEQLNVSIVSQSNRIYKQNDIIEDQELQTQSLRTLANRLKKFVDLPKSQSVLKNRRLNEHRFRTELSNMENSCQQIKRSDRKYVDLMPEMVRESLRKSTDINNKLRQELGEQSVSQRVFLNFKLFKSECEQMQLRTSKSTDQSQRTHTSIDQGGMIKNQFSNIHHSPLNVIEQLKQQSKIIKSKHNLFRNQPKSRILLPRYQLDL